MKKFCLLLILSVAAFFPRTQAQTIEAHLSDSSFVQLLTCGPGEEFYTTWGHSAIRICDSTLGIDLVYNYGCFDFDTKHFYLKFCKGRLDYFLSRSNYERFISSYAYEGRQIWAQLLDLTTQEKNNLFVLLETNYLPQYRYYKYDFFRDNCATRIRDIVNNSLIHRTLFVEENVQPAVSYRNLLYAPTESYLLWWRLGVDIVLGARCDKECTNLECMFSPIEMMNQVDTTCLKTKNEQGEWVSTGKLLMKEKVELLPNNRDAFHLSVNPTLTFWVLFLLVLSLTGIAWVKGLRLRWLDIILFLLPALISVVIIFLWFFSDHYSTKWNWNLLWANPLFFYFLIRLRRSHRVVLYVGMLCLLVVMTGFWWMPQQFNAAVMPICLTLFVRLLDKFRPLPEPTR